VALFKKKMQDPVKGSAFVAEVEGGLGGGGRYGGSSVWASGRMKLTVTADGVLPTDIDWRGLIRCKYCPSTGQTIPVTVDRANPQRIGIKWKELPLMEDVMRKETEDINEDARQIWRDNLANGSCTQEEFEKQMLEFDGPNWREKQPAEFLAAPTQGRAAAPAAGDLASQLGSLQTVDLHSQPTHVREAVVADLQAAGIPAQVGRPLAITNAAQLQAAIEVLKKHGLISSA
jgi:hypothetical protein